MPNKIMESEEDEKLFFDSFSQKRLLVNCSRNLQSFLQSEKWKAVHNKLLNLDIKVPSNLFSCKHCNEPVEGYYFYKSKKVILCANNIKDEDFNYHALYFTILAYDDARTYIEPNNPTHLACSMIRAVNLSGLCFESKYSWLLEKNAKKLDRVKRNTIQKLSTHFNINKDDAEEYVHHVWDSCFYQQDPFN